MAPATEKGVPEAAGLAVCAGRPEKAWPPPVAKKKGIPQGRACGIPFALKAHWWWAQRLRRINPASAPVNKNTKVAGSGMAPPPPGGSGGLPVPQ